MSNLDPVPRDAYSYRSDAAVPDFSDEHWHVVMDDRCGLCARTARRIARADRQNRVRIVPISAPLGHALMRHYGLDANNPQTWLLIKDGLAFGGLSAAIDLFPRLSYSYMPILILKLLPTPWRDAAYSAVARRRYRLFGYADLCSMPDESVQSRLISSSETRR